jgi:copper(I)-binding protein
MLRVLCLISVVLSMTGCSQQGLQVTDAWARATPPGLTVGVAYLTIHNRSTQDDELIGATTPHAGRVELHATQNVNGMMSMQRQTTVKIAAREALRLEPNGLHFMLLELQQPLRADERIPLTLQFANSGPVIADIYVRSVSE